MYLKEVKCIRYQQGKTIAKRGCYNPEAVCVSSVAMQEETMFEPIKRYADILYKRFGGSLLLENIFEVLAETSADKRCTARIEFNDEFPRDRELAIAVANKTRDWNAYTIYIRNFLRDDRDGQRLVLAHELCHVVFGQLTREVDADSFAACILGMSYGQYRQKVHSYSKEFGSSEF